MSDSEYREGSLDAPTRHPIDWQNPDFYDEDKALQELERVFDICHGCRRCVSLCHAFPTLFDLIDESETLEVDGVAKEDYVKVVDHCYLCDLCYMTKCPYVPPHPWSVDFPHLMLRAKAIKFKQGKSRLRDRMLSSTDRLGSLAGIPVVAETINAANRNALARKALDKTLGIHEQAPLPEYQRRTLKQRLSGRDSPAEDAEAAGPTRGRVALFATCYCNYNAPGPAEDLVTVLEHNGIPASLCQQEVCCGMPKLELGDLDSVQRARDVNIPVLAKLVDEGWDLLAPVPSCVLMFKQELPLMFPDDEDVQKVGQAFFDPFEYLMLRHHEGKLDTQFRQSLGKISYHAPCHQRVQNIGLKTREVLELIPDTSVEVIERCSGHDGTYALRSENYEIAKKICRPVVNRVKKAEADHYVSDCPMAGDLIESGMEGDADGAESPFTLLRQAYGL